MNKLLLALAGGSNTLSRGWFQLLPASSAGWVGTDINSNAFYYNGNTYFAYIDSSGNAKVSKFNHSTRAVTTSPAVISSGLTADIHCSPSILVRQSDHKLVLAAAPHNDAHMYVAISSNAEDISSWGAPTDIATTLTGTKYTYANLFQLSGESGKIYMFFRDERDGGTTAALCYSTSTDGGATWTAETTLYYTTGKQSYWVVGSDFTSRIDFAVSNGNASDGDTSSLYHFYYDGAFRNSGGTSIGSPAFTSISSFTKIYDGAANGYVRVPYSIIPGASPVVGISALDPAGSGQPEKYWYATYSGGVWTANLIDSSGSIPVSGFSEGGVAIDRTNSNVVYVSKSDGTTWKVYQYQTSNAGATWSTLALGNDGDGTNLNLRPVTPKNAASGLLMLWCFGPHGLVGGLEEAADQIRGYPSS